MVSMSDQRDNVDLHEGWGLYLHQVITLNNSGRSV